MYLHMQVQVVGLTVVITELDAALVFRRLLCAMF